VQVLLLTTAAALVLVHASRIKSGELLLPVH
jgi:hypothetical protein